MSYDGFFPINEASNPMTVWLEKMILMISIHFI